MQVVRVQRWQPLPVEMEMTPEMGMEMDTTKMEVVMEQLGMQQAVGAPEAVTAGAAAAAMAAAAAISAAALSWAGGVAARAAVGETAGAVHQALPLALARG